jgi:hypothetical protein
MSKRNQSGKKRSNAAEHKKRKPEEDLDDVADEDGGEFARSGNIDSLF